MENNKRASVDFHTHADPLNLESGKKIVDLAVINNVVAVAIFARKQVLPYYKELIKYGEDQKVKVITGIESTVLFDNKPIDFVSLGFDHELMLANNKLKEKESNQKIAVLQIEFLKQKGFSFDNIDFPENSELLKAILNGKITEKAIRLCEILTSEQYFDILINKLIKDNQLLWNKIKEKYAKFENYNNDPTKIKAKLMYLVYFDANKEGFEYVFSKYKRNTLPIDDQINNIHSYGGVMLYSPEGDYNKETWDMLKKLNIDGLMAWHGEKLGLNKGVKDIPIEVIEECINTKLLVLGGSDYSERDWKLGTGNNNQLFMNPRRLIDLEDRLRLYKS